VEGDVSLEQWIEALDPVPARARAGALVRRFAWTSPINAAALLGETPESGEVAGLPLGHRRWSAMINAATPPDPVVLKLSGGLQPYPFPLAGTPSERTGTLIEAFAMCEEAEGERGNAISSAVLGPELLEWIQDRLRKTARRVRRLEAELARLPDPQALRSIGDLILARYREIPAGAVVARLQGFNGEAVEIRLEPGEPAHATAARYYQSATKAERAAERLPGIIAEAQAELARVESLLERVHAGQAGDAEVREAMGPTRTTRTGEAAGTPLPYRTFRSSGGLEIRVGRGARFNDDLTFHHSAPADIWLHARHTAGAHVILRWQGEGRPPARDLQEAAILAALHSKARTSGSVPVDWTLRKYVRKPRKSPPGQVMVEREETLFVEPDPSLLETLVDGRSAT
jgi:predicted ribosome quality control (RQC) complex YloA/Tae2 family protein